MVNLSLEVLILLILCFTNDYVLSFFTCDVFCVLCCELTVACNSDRCCSATSRCSRDLLYCACYMSVYHCVCCVELVSNLLQGVGVE